MEFSEDEKADPLWYALHFVGLCKP